MDSSLSPDSVADPRLASALDWCRRTGITDTTVAVPFQLPSAELQALLEVPDVTSIVTLAPLPRHIDPRLLGVFLPTDYSWQLPERLGKHIVYIGGRDGITARMIRTALAQGARSFVYWSLDTWSRRPVSLVALHKLSTRAMGLAQTSIAKLGAAITRVAASAGTWTVRAERALRRRLAPDSRVGAVPWSAEQSPPRGLLSVNLLETPVRRRLKRLLNTRSLSLGIQGGLRSPSVLIACPTLVAGGAERQIVNTAIGLHQRFGLEVTVLVSRLSSPPGNDFFLQPLAAAGIDVQEVQSVTSSTAAWTRHQKSGATHLLPKLHALLGRLPPELAQEVANIFLTIQALRPTLLHAWLDHSSVCAGLAGLVAGVPRVILSSRNVSPLHFPYILQPYMRPAYRAMAGRPETIFVNNSRGGADDYARWLGIARDRFQVVYNGVDLQRARATVPARTVGLRRRNQIPEDALLIGGMFRLSQEKRPLLWIDTVSAVVKARSDVFGLVFGAGPLKHELEARLERHRIADRVRLAPPIEDSATALAAFDIMLLTSRWEGTPNVAIEAQAVGTPVVLSGGGGAAEALVHGETGLFVEHADARELADALRTLVDDPRLRQRLGTSARVFVEQRFGLQRMLSETLNIYGLSGVDRPLGASDCTGFAVKGINRERSAT